MDEGAGYPTAQSDGPDGAAVPERPEETLGAVLTLMMDLLRCDKKQFATLMEVETRSVERYLTCASTRSHPCSSTGKAGRHVKVEVLARLETAGHTRGIAVEVIDRMWEAAGWPTQRHPLAYDRVLQQSVGHYLHTLRGEIRRDVVARQAFPPTSETDDFSTALAIIDRVEQMSAGDFPPPAQVHAFITALTHLRPLDAAQLRTIAVKYLWLQDLVAEHTQRTVIGIIVSSTIHNAFWAEFVKICVDLAMKNSVPYYIVPCHHEESERTQLHHLRALRRFELAGVILAPARSHKGDHALTKEVGAWINAVQAEGIPVLVVDHPFGEVRPDHHVYVDNRSIGRTAAQVLCRARHTQLGLLLDLASGLHQERGDAFIEAATSVVTGGGASEVTIRSAHGVDTHASVAHRDGRSSDYRALKAAARQLLDEEPPVTAVFCGTSAGALALLSVLHDQERVAHRATTKAWGPARRRISVIAGDDVPLLEVAKVDAVAYDARTLAESAWVQMLDAMENRDRPAEGQASVTSTGKVLTINNALARGSVQPLSKRKGVKRREGTTQPSHR